MPHLICNFFFWSVEICQSYGYFKKSLNTRMINMQNFTGDWQEKLMFNMWMNLVQNRQSFKGNVLSSILCNNSLNYESFFLSKFNATVNSFIKNIIFNFFLLRNSYLAVLFTIVKQNRKREKKMLTNSL